MLQLRAPSITVYEHDPGPDPARTRIRGAAWPALHGEHFHSHWGIATTGQ
jgi:hypothetical protein